MAAIGDLRGWGGHLDSGAAATVEDASCGDGCHGAPAFVTADREAAVSGASAQLVCRLGAIRVGPDRDRHGPRVRFHEGPLEVPADAAARLAAGEDVVVVKHAGRTTLLYDRDAPGAAREATRRVVGLAGEKALERAVARPARKQRGRRGRRKGGRR